MGIYYCELKYNKTICKYSLWPSNFRIIIPKKVFCGATWPLRTGIVNRSKTWSQSWVTAAASRSYSTLILLLVQIISRSHLGGVRPEHHNTESRPRRNARNRSWWLGSESVRSAVCRAGSPSVCGAPAASGSYAGVTRLPRDSVPPPRAAHPRWAAGVRRRVITASTCRRRCIGNVNWHTYFICKTFACYVRKRVWSQRS